MAFDPDAFLGTTPTPKKSGFDPDAFLGGKKEPAQPFDMRTGAPPEAPKGPALPPVESLPENRPKRGFPGASTDQERQWDKWLRQGEERLSKETGKPLPEEEKAPDVPFFDKVKSVASDAAGAVSRSAQQFAEDPVRAGGAAALATMGGLASGASAGFASPESMLQRAKERAGEAWLAWKSGQGTAASVRDAMGQLYHWRDIVQASKEQPVARFGGELAGATRGPGAAVTRGISTAMPAATTAGRVVRAGVAAGAGGAVEGAGRTIAEGGSASEAIDAAKTGAIVSGALGAGGQAVAEGAGALAPKLVAKRRDIVGKEITDGADATHARRAVGRAGEDVRQVAMFTERHPKVAKYTDKPERLIPAVNEVVDNATSQTGPIYQRFDQVAGKVPVRDVVSQLDGEIATYAKQAGNEQFRDALQKVRDNVLRAAKAAGTDEWSHKELRAWVSRTLEAEKRTVGSIAETTNYEIADAVHEAADKVLKQRLKVAAMLHPELADDATKLTALNTDIAMGLKIRQAAENAEARAYWARKGRLGDAAAGVVAGVAGVGAGPGAAVAGWAATKAAPAVMKKINRGSWKALARLSTAAREGRDTSRLAEAAAAAGVPAFMINTALKRAEASRSKKAPIDAGPDPFAGAPVGDDSDPFSR